MKYLLILSTICITLLSCGESSSSHIDNSSVLVDDESYPYALVIHGGAGTITREAITADQDAAYRSILTAVLQRGDSLLAAGVPAINVVTEVIMIMEDSPLFNAGVGAVMTSDGRHELDASIMTGRARNAGAVSGVSIIKNPILAARAVLEHSDHVMLSGTGAEAFSAAQGLEIVDNRHFTTERRRKSLERAKEREAATGSIYDGTSEDDKYGTVGAVALDRSGEIVAATSTGGMTNKRYGRVGDSPIIGAGTYADKTCGVSCTGWGEYFMRLAVAHEVSAAMRYGDFTLQYAADHVISQDLSSTPGTGGLIALDAQGGVAMPFNTEGMYRGYARPGELIVQIYKDED